MNELALTGIGLLIFVVAALGSVGVVVSRRALPQPEPEPQPQRAKRRYKRLSQIEREAERAIILAALLAGVEPVLIARLLRGSPDWNRRKVNTVKRWNEQRIKREEQAREQAATNPTQANQRLANAI